MESFCFVFNKTRRDVKKNKKKHPIDHAPIAAKHLLSVVVPRLVKVVRRASAPNFSPGIVKYKALVWRPLTASTSCTSTSPMPTYMSRMQPRRFALPWPNASLVKEVPLLLTRLPLREPLIKVLKPSVPTYS
jgi:hypothetical protein